MGLMLREGFTCDVIESLSQAVLEENGFDVLYIIIRMELKHFLFTIMSPIHCNLMVFSLIYIQVKNLFMVDSKAGVSLRKMMIRKIPR
jgi:hypothetical protein